MRMLNRKWTQKSVTQGGGGASLDRAESEPNISTEAACTQRIGDEVGTQSGICSYTDEFTQTSF